MEYILESCIILSDKDLLGTFDAKEMQLLQLLVTFNSTESLVH